MKNIPPIKSPNPQGKGLVTVLQEIDSRQTAVGSVTDQAMSKTLHDYALSRLVLCAEFNFKPVANKPYYLYVKDKTLKLSLIAPSEWRNNVFGFYICKCELKSSMFWTFSEKSEDSKALAYLALAVEPLKDSLLSDFFLEKPLKATLPFYDERLPFHRRVLANALASTMAHAMPGSLSKSLKHLNEKTSKELAQLPFF